jgi:hypothetical protein
MSFGQRFLPVKLELLGKDPSGFFLFRLFQSTQAHFDRRSIRVSAALKDRAAISGIPSFLSMGGLHSDA